MPFIRVATLQWLWHRQQLEPKLCCRSGRRGAATKMFPCIVWMLSSIDWRCSRHRQHLSHISAAGVMIGIKCQCSLHHAVWLRSSLSSLDWHGTP
jgi:hypothetical protein